MPKSRRIASALITVVVILIPIVLILQWQNITDTLRLWGYQPPARIEAIAKDTTMNSYAQKLFYVNHPDLSSQDTFNQKCQSNAEQSIVLGCFISGQGIYIYDVDDPRLAGIHEVTSVHEMLHQAYERLGGSEKAQVNTMLDNAYKTITDERIKETIENYRKQDPSVVPNEMHSVLGTEVRNLPQDLENYYKKYFDNRSKIVDLAEKYEAEFTKRKDQVKSYDDQLEDIKKQIDAIRISVEVQTVEVKEFRNQMNSLLASKDYDAYNTKVPIFNAKVAELNSKASSANSLIDQYNDILQKRNEVALEQQDLVKAIDSRIDSFQSQ